MFFMIGISQGRKDFPYVQTIQCPACGGFGRYQVFMTYSVLSLFFIPCFTWNKKYYVQTSCCGTVYALDPDIGGQIARGREVPIRQADLHEMRQGSVNRTKRCLRCGFETDEAYDYCPKCGAKF